MSRRLRVTATLSLLLLFPAAPAAAQVNTCLYPDGTTPSRTTLALEKNIGCWWVHL